MMTRLNLLLRPYMLKIFTLMLYFFGMPSVKAQDSEPLKTAVERSLHPFLTHPKRRVEGERIVTTGGQVEIWRYESFETGDVETKLCDAARSLLFGRLPSSQGVRSLFVNQPHLRDISLIHFRDKTTVNPDLNGKYVQSRQRIVVARMTLLRSSAISINESDVKRRLAGSLCVEEAKTLLSDLWVSELILERREALKVASVLLNAQKRERQLKANRKNQETVAPRVIR